MGRVIVKAIVQGVKFAQCAIGAPVTLQGKVTAAVHVLAGNALGRYRQKPLAVQLKQVGAFPHIAKGFGGGNGVDVVPMQLVGAFKHQHFAMVVQCSGTQHHIVAPIQCKHFGIAHMAGQPGGIILVVHQAALVVQMDGIAAGGKADIVPAPLLDVVIFAGVLDIAGIVQVQHAVLHQSGAGINAMAVKRFVRVQHYGQAFPVEQIAAAHVPPVLDPSRGVKRAVLIKYMVFIADLAQPVGVVQPAHRGLNMQLLPVGIRRHTGGPGGFHHGDKTLQITLQGIHNR